MLFGGVSTEFNMKILIFLTLILINAVQGNDDVCPGFVCKNGECLDDIFDRCNGELQCSDNSDESSCSRCASGFICDDEECTTPISNRCNTRCDCTDCSDELNCSFSNSTGGGGGEGGSINVVAIIIGVSVGGFLVVFCIPIVILICVGAIVVFTKAKAKESKRKADYEESTATQLRTVVSTDYHQSAGSSGDSNPLHSVTTSTS